MLSTTNLLTFFLTGAGLGISAALSPGPFQSLIIRESLLGGLRRAAPVTFAPLLVDIPIAFVLVFLLGQAPPAFLQAIRGAGAALLLYLAWGLWRQITNDEHSDAGLETASPQSARRGFVLGASMLLLSPGSYLYWSSVLGPLLLDALELSFGHALSFVAAFYIFSIGGLLLIAAIIGRAGRISPAWRRGLHIFSMLLLVSVAVWLLASLFVA